MKRWQRLQGGPGFLPLANTRSRFGPRWRQLLVIAGLISSILLTTPATSRAQRSSDVLSANYFQSLSSFYSGDYNDSGNGFRDSIRGAMRMGDTRWIDSIAYHSMAGEACYQTGQMKQALEHFGFALQYYLQYADWMQQVQFPPRIGPRTTVSGPVPWGQSSRRFRIGQ